MMASHIALRLIIHWLDFTGEDSIMARLYSPVRHLLTATLGPGFRKSQGRDTQSVQRLVDVHRRHWTQLGWVRINLQSHQHESECGVQKC